MLFASKTQTLIPANIIMNLQYLLNQRTSWLCHISECLETQGLSIFHVISKEIQKEMLFIFYDNSCCVMSTWRRVERQLDSHLVSISSYLFLFWIHHKEWSSFNYNLPGLDISHLLQIFLGLPLFPCKQHVGTDYLQMACYHSAFMNSTKRKSCHPRVLTR